MTYSIVARDPRSGEIGVAVATAWPGAGAVVPWLEPGVGAVATQSFTNIDLGPRGLALLRGGRPAPDALTELLRADRGRDMRQVGLVDATGRSAAHTGDRCVAEAGHVCAAGVSVQANMLERADVWLAMLDTFGRARGDLADRLAATLHAAEQVGGDIRGSRSAALLVAPGAATEQPWARRFDLRVEAADRPLEVIGRFLRVARAYEALASASEAAEAGELAAALEYTSAAHELAPDEAQVGYWHALALVANGRPDEAGPLLDAALDSEPRLAEFGRRFTEAGHGGALASAMAAVRRRTPPARE